MEISFTDMLSKTFNFYLKNIKTYFKTLLVLYVLPNFIVNTIMILLFTAIGFGFGFGAINNLGDTGSIVLSVLGGGIFAVFLFTLILISLIMTVSIIKLTIHLKNGKTPKISELFHESLRYLGSIIQFSIIMMAITFGLAIVFIVPGTLMIVFELFGSIIPGILILIFLILILFIILIYIRTNWVFSYLSIIIDKVPVIKSFKYSKGLVKGNWLRVFGYNLLFGLIVSGAMMVIMIPLMFLIVLLSLIPIFGSIATNVLSDLMMILVFPLSFIFLIEFYFNMKKLKQPKKMVQKKK